MSLMNIIKFLRRGFSYKASLNTQVNKTTALGQQATTSTTPNNINLVKKFSTNEDINNGIPIIKYEDVKQLHKYPEKLLVDVREPQEIQETGQIPNSINIPLGMVAQELSAQGDRKDFRSKYGREKPQAETEIIFYCRIGKRSQTAAQTAKELGYKNIKNYLGSWMEWAEKQNLPK